MGTCPRAHVSLINPVIKAHTYIHLSLLTTVTPDCYSEFYSTIPRIIVLPQNDLGWYTSFEFGHPCNAHVILTRGPLRKSTPAVVDFEIWGWPLTSYQEEDNLTPGRSCWLSTFEVIGDILDIHGRIGNDPSSSPGHSPPVGIGTMMIESCTAGYNARQRPRLIGPSIRCRKVHERSTSTTSLH